MGNVTTLFEEAIAKLTEANEELRDPRVAEALGVLKVLKTMARPEGARKMEHLTKSAPLPPQIAAAARREERAPQMCQCDGGPYDGTYVPISPEMQKGHRTTPDGRSVYELDIKGSVKVLRHVSETGKAPV